jgi:trimethylamine---corrinoid protein Co-methyltransferase
MLESEALLMLDDELAGMAQRLARGIVVDDEHLAVDLVKDVVGHGTGAGAAGNYLAEAHTVRHFRHEHYIPRLLVREPYDAWEKAGAVSALDHARARAREIVANHQPRILDPAVELALDGYRQMVAQRPLDEFYLGELAENQDWENL